MDEKSYQNSFPVPDGGLPSEPQNAGGQDDLPPAYPTNPVQFSGYQNVGGVCDFVPDPNAQMNDPNRPAPIFQEVPYLNEQDARDALAQHVSEHCCYGSSPVKNLTFTNLQSSNTYRYVLDTFTETRMTEYVFEPYFTQIIINNGQPPPQPWDIQVNPMALFQDEIKLIEIPNTAQVEICTKCSGVGTRFCYSCGGRGMSRCSSCGGCGTRHENHESRRCFSCNGSGTRSCFSCGGRGRIVCRTCKSSGRLKWYLQLKVVFKNNQDDYFKKSEQIPDEELRQCLSKNIYNEQNIRVYPISNHQDQDINNASVSLITSHLNKFPHSRILYQRQEVNAIPVTLCTYKFNEKDYEFRVYGLNNRVYSPDYPRKCLCCTIL